MKKIFMLLVSFSLLMVSYTQAGTTTINIEKPISVDKPAFPLVNWVSNSPSDVVTIENGSGASLTIHITVNGNDQMDNPGITISNCGNTTTIKAGSAGVCMTNDARNPVKFSSNGANAATGTYQITQQ